MLTLLAAGLLLPPAGMRLVWADEFSKPGRPDPANWVYEDGFVRNRELQWYQADNARVEEGLLVIEGRKERVKNPAYKAGSSDWRMNREYAEYTSSCLETRGKHAWKYGRFEIRARFRAQTGLWPAIWTLGVEKPWPQNGEIDILEYYHHSILANTAYGKDNPTWDEAKIPYPKVATDPNWDRRFHTWTMDWTEDLIRLSLDGRVLNETDIRNTRNPDGFNPFRQPHFLLLNLAIGATGGDPTKADFPARYEVDYVRVYQKA